MSPMAIQVAMAQLKRAEAQRDRLANALRPYVVDEAAPVEKLNGYWLRIHNEAREALAQIDRKAGS